MLGPRSKTTNRIALGTSLKAYKLDEDNSYVPETLYKYSLPKPNSGLPIIPFRFNDNSIMNSPSGKESLVGSPTKEIANAMFKQDVFNKTMKANQILKKDRQHLKSDFSKKSYDVSYLMDTKPYLKEPRINEKTATSLKRSLDLITSEMHMIAVDHQQNSSLDEKDDKPGSRRDKNIYMEMEEYGKEDSMLSDNLMKFKQSYLIDGGTPRDRTKVNKSIEPDGSFRVLPKIIDVSKLGSTFEAPDSPNKNEVKDAFLKIKKGTIIQKRAQNKNLAVPSGRKEVVILSDWLSNTLEEIKQKTSMNLADLLDQTQLIYTFCLEELIKQVTVQCSERGQLLDKIWEAYMDLFMRAIDINNREKKKLINHYIEEMKGMKKIHEKEIEDQLEKYSQLKKERDDLDFTLNKYKERNDFLEDKVERLLQDVINYKQKIYQMQYQIPASALIDQKNNLIAASNKSMRRKNVKNKNRAQKNSNEVNNTDETGKQDNDVQETQEGQVETEEKTSELVTTNQDNDEIIEVHQPMEGFYRDQETDTLDLVQVIETKDVMNKSIQWEEEMIEKPKKEPVQENIIIQKEEEQPIPHKEPDIKEPENGKEQDQGLQEEHQQEKSEETESSSSEEEDKASLADIQADNKDKTQSIRIGQSISRKPTNDNKMINKEALIKFLERYQNHQQSEGLESELENKVISFLLDLLKGQEDWKIQDLNKLVSKFAERKSQILDIPEQDEPESSERSELKQDQKPATIQNIQNAADKVKDTQKGELIEFVNNLEKRLDEIVNCGGRKSISAETIELLKKILEEKDEFLEEKYKPLLEKVVLVLEETMNQNTLLKIENKEQALDLTKMLEKDENTTNQTMNLLKQVHEWKDKVMNLQEINDKLNEKLLRRKTISKEENIKKMEKIGSLLIDYTSGGDPEKRGLTEESKDGEGASVPALVKAVSDPNSKHKKLENQNLPQKNAATLAVIDNISEIITKKNVALTEEDWSESEGEAERVVTDNTRKGIQRTNTRSKNQRKHPNKLSIAISMLNQKNRPRNAFLFSNQYDGLKLKKVVRVTSVNGESANALLNKAKGKKHIKSSLTKLSLLKFISQTYVDRLKDNTKKTAQIPLHITVYESFINKYGLKKVAENKCLQFFESVIALSAESKKVKRFKDLLGLGESFEVEELSLYLSALKLLDTMGNGILIASNIQEKLFVSLDQAEFAARELFENKIDPQNVRDLIVNIQNAQSVDRVNRLIELEDVMDNFLYVQRNLQNTVKGFVKEIFNAADLDNDEIIEFFEFNILYKHLEKERYNKNQAKDLFFEHADLLLPDGSNEPVVSFNKFTWICLEMKLFTEEKQREFARVRDFSDPVQNIKDLERDLKEKLNQIRIRFIKSQAYTPHVKTIMTKLYSSIKNPLKSRKVVWLTYRLLDEESKSQLLDYEIKSMLPKEFSIIQTFVDEVEGWIGLN